MLKLKFSKEDLEGRKLLFTSDLHFSHLNICKMCNRPFIDKWEMNKALIENWNKVVSNDDIVFILGDFCFDQKSVWAKVLSVLNGKKHLVLGNHDKEKNIPYEMFESVRDITKLWVQNESGKYDMIFLSHYPTLSYSGMFDGGYHFHGHIHTNPYKKGKEDHLIQYLTRAYDVGVDNNNLQPIELTEILNIINNGKV